MVSGARWGCRAGPGGGAGLGLVGQASLCDPRPSSPQTQASGEAQSWVLTVTPRKQSLVLTSCLHLPLGEVSPSPYPMLPINVTGRGMNPRVFRPVGWGGGGGPMRGRAAHLPSLLEVDQSPLKGRESQGHQKVSPCPSLPAAPLRLHYREHTPGGRAGHTPGPGVGPGSGARQGPLAQPSEDTWRD